MLGRINVTLSFPSPNAQSSTKWMACLTCDASTFPIVEMEGRTISPSTTSILIAHTGLAFPQSLSTTSLQYSPPRNPSFLTRSCPFHSIVFGRLHHARHRPTPLQACETGPLHLPPQVLGETNIEEQRLSQEVLNTVYQ